MDMLNPLPMTGVLDCIDEEGADVVTGILNARARRLLLEETEMLTWRTSLSVIDHSKVQQDYKVVTHFHSDSLFRTLADELLLRLTLLFAESPVPFQSDRLFRFNELRVQRYRAGSRGISPHRDQGCCKILIALFVLEDGGRFGLCDSRIGVEPVSPRILDAPAGSLILMKAPGFKGQQGLAAQPMHFVDSVTRQRTTFGLRYIG
ncbi:hypothetical protein K8R03_00035 [Candidatus Kaiserbacteria bacterium]|nr:hypothetical protein [Candidatus Kaiserbacteria bacterium]